MSYHYWIINFLPVDIDAHHVIKLFYVENRQFTILSSKKVKYKGKLYECRWYYL